MPGDPEWPTHLDDLGDARPLVLWLRGTADLRLTCVNSVAVVGSRAATGYGNHVAIELATVPAEKGVGVVSGGPCGIDTSRAGGALPRSLRPRCRPPAGRSDDDREDGREGHRHEPPGDPLQGADRETGVRHSRQAAV